MSTVDDTQPCPICHEHSLVTIELGGLSFMVCRAVPPNVLAVYTGFTVAPWQQRLGEDILDIYDDDPDAEIISFVPPER